ncbi:amino acid ABC transporter substrate-binding protein, PAAT family [Magnetococcus marinus MC-1]|uniref:Amino acid ABC transporter substrate-binding protein, PAAT family n=1 Tax=Magnetococcus marinus (strain ATCC BAA-1437 / JCM 17883 / MC-1) TaxID=156889 RepID=A0L5R0_MAGMM|nr:ABC transporter substrate-binding protein [Magnetococcus marinus]ABK43303.1 amino acid ABC transporter substrate-binding protein, PAAT family [Magnetococcus marinus MC-1]
MLSGICRWIGCLSTVIFLVALAEPAIAQAESRLQTIQARQTVRVCIWPGYFSITYRNPRSQQLEGIDIDLAHAFAADLGVTVEFIDSSFSKLKENLTQDRCDIAMHGVGVRADRAEFMDFSAPYLRSGIYAVVDKNHFAIQAWQDIDRKGHIIVVQKGTYMEPVMRSYLHQGTLTVVDTFKAREQEVEAGRADVFMTDYPYGRRMALLSSWAKLLTPPQVLAPTDYAYAVPKGEPEWLARVNGFVRQIKRDGRLKRFAEKNGLMPIVLE